MHIMCISPIGAVARSSAVYGQGVGLVYVSGLMCNGTETALVNCTGANFSDTSVCPHSRDAGVMCQRKQGKFKVKCTVPTL